MTKMSVFAKHLQYSHKNNKIYVKYNEVYRFQNFDFAIGKRFSVNKCLKKTEVGTKTEKPDTHEKLCTRHRTKTRQTNPTTN